LSEIGNIFSYQKGDKSHNYSVIEAIGCTQFYAIIFIRGVVKATDYALFLLELLVGY
jgi:hypothetical protein